jgi:DNA gyrase subunit A
MVIDLIRGSATPEDARNGLMEGAFIEDRDKFWKQFGPLIEQADTDEYPREEGNALSEAQARAILDMRLQKLTGLERDKVKQEYDELQERIAYLKSILESEELQREIAAEELQEVKEKYGDERRTDVTAADGEISIEDLIANEEVVVTISNLGYIKRTPVSEYRKQSRFIASTHNYLLLFTESGRCHWLRVYEIPEASKTSSGRVIQNILAIPKEDRIKAYINIQDLTDEEFISNNNIVFCTRKTTILSSVPVMA